MYSVGLLSFKWDITPVVVCIAVTLLLYCMVTGTRQC
jgi:hypothetical protein